MYRHHVWYHHHVIKSIYTAKRRFKLPTDMNLHGVDFELVFILADGREWFRKAEVKPLTIENKLQVSLSFT